MKTPAKVRCNHRGWEIQTSTGWGSEKSWGDNTLQNQPLEPTTPTPEGGKGKRRNLFPGIKSFYAEGNMRLHRKSLKTKQGFGLEKARWERKRWECVENAKRIPNGRKGLAHVKKFRQARRGRGTGLHILRTFQETLGKRGRGKSMPCAQSSKFRGVAKGKQLGKEQSIIEPRESTHQYSGSRHTRELRRAPCQWVETDLFWFRMGQEGYDRRCLIPEA